MTKSLLSFDTDQIKSYVFATDKLKEIRGASALLDELNRQEMPTLVGGDKTFANGGSGLFLVDNQRAEQAGLAVEKVYREHTGTASITSVVLDLPPDFQNTETINSSFRLLSYRLRAAKDNKVAQFVLVSHPFLRFCDSCGTECAEHEYMTDDETDRGFLCGSCIAKRQKDRQLKTNIQQIVEKVIHGKKISEERSLWHYLIPKLHEQKYPLEDYSRPDDFNKLADLSSPSNYIGLIYADGDGMGKVLESMETLAQLKNFSESVDSSVYEAVVEAIVQHLKPDESGAKAKFHNKDGSKPWPFDILLLGGDDLVMVTRADSTLEVGLTIMEQFTALTRQKYGEPLRLSVGIAIAHANYPFGQLLRLGESALKFAKKEGVKRRQAGENWEGGLLNFVVVSSTNHLDFEAYYDEQLNDTAEEVLTVDKNLYRTLRPYSATDLRKLLYHTRHLKALRAPRSKLEQLRTLIFQTKRQAMVDSLTLLFHWRSEKQRTAIQDVVADFIPKPPEHALLFPWFQIGPKEGGAKFMTPLLDLVEIFDFISEEAAHEFDD